MASAAREFARLRALGPPAAPRRVMERAVVLGGSMAGLTAARVLADHADEVLVVERDTTTGTEPRSGVPQGTQVHALLPAGQQQLERWFPGLAPALRAAGAVVPAPEQVRMYVDGVARPSPDLRGETGDALVTTRPFLEDAVRARVAALPNVRTVAGRADGVLVTGGRVTGARYRPAGDSDPVEVGAGLVVDATGRSSRAADWLAAHGLAAPPLRRMPIRLHYASALFRRDPAVSDVAVAVSQDRPGPGRTARSGGINAVEGDRWIVLVAGYGEDRPGRDPDEFVERCLRDFPPEFGAVASGAEMLGDVVTYHQADSRRRDQHAGAGPPPGFVAAGDAVASFNPIYGQGMTSAAMHAAALSAYLRADPRLDEPARGYVDRVRVVVDAAWQLSTTADLALPHVDGPYPPGYRLLAPIADGVFAAAARDAALNRRLGMVTTMLSHPSTLARPSVLARALAGRFRAAD